jgi:hypothetical protein
MTSKVVYRHPRADKKDYEILFTFRILYDGWEMDNEAWVARDKKGKVVLLMTSHGGLYDYGRDVSELHAALEETKRSLAGIKQALALINSASQEGK